MFDATLLVEFEAGLILKHAVILLKIDLKPKERSRYKSFGRIHEIVCEKFKKISQYLLAVSND